MYSIHCTLIAYYHYIMNSAELRRDSEGSRYVSVLCGLGSTKDGTPYFPEHDLLVNIDADLTHDDIGAVSNPFMP